MKVGIYCRVSKEKNGESIEDQKKLGIQYCKNNKYDYEVFIDEGISGTVWERPEFQKLLTDISEEKIQMVWAFDDSRFQRSNEIRGLINQHLKKHNVMYCTHTNGIIDWDNPHQDFIGGLMSEFNKYHVTLSKIKTKRALKLRAESGKGWGILPYGFEYDKNGYYALNDDECLTVKEIFKLSLSGMGTNRIAKKLNFNGVKTRYNQFAGNIRLDKTKGKEETKLIKKKDIRWAGNTIRGILNNKMFYGYKKINDTVINIPALFSLEYWEKVNYNFKFKNKNTIKSGGTKKYEYLLNGVIECGKCGRNYNGKTRASKKDHFYYCMSKRLDSSCGNRSINIDKIESAIWNILFTEQKIFEHIKNDLGNIEKIEQYISKKKALEEERVSLKKKRETMLDYMENANIDYEEVKHRFKKYRIREEEIQNQIKDLNFKIKSANIHKESEIYRDSTIFTNMTFEKKKELIQKYIASIKVHWVNENYEHQKIRYYVIEIIDSINHNSMFITNYHGMDLNEWFGIELVNDNPSFTYILSGRNIISVPYRWFKNGEIEIALWSLVPDTSEYGENVDFYDEDDLISFYGKNKYLKLKAERDHKLKSNLIKTILEKRIHT